MNVAFLVFNRPVLTRRVFEKIREARPDRLLVVADGPRGPNDVPLCDEVRRIVREVDWPCKLDTNFADRNMGCRSRVSSGLDWAFGEVEDCIVLEDDCLPDPSFFPFCTDLLDRYRHDERIIQINGSCVLKGPLLRRGSYYFTRYGGIWGWAAWRRSWKLYDLEMKRWPELRERGWHKQYFTDHRDADLFEKRWDDAYDGVVDTWDAQWLFARMSNDRLAVNPYQNLTSNIGFEAGALHTYEADSFLSNYPLDPMPFPLVHPAKIVRNHRMDALFAERVSRYQPPAHKRLLTTLQNRHLYGAALRRIPVLGERWAAARARRHG